MNTNITINDINKVRAQALRWTKRIKESKLLKWESLPYYCMRIGRCMRKLGLQYTVIDECETLYRNEKAYVSYALPLALMIVKCCQQLADYIYERPTPQPLP